MKVFLRCVILILLCSCSASPRYYLVTGQAQGGTYSVKYASSTLAPQLVKVSCDSILAAVDRTFSIYNPISLTSRLNRGECTLEQACRDSLFNDLYLRSMAVREQTGGAVDVTAGALFERLGFGGGQNGAGDSATCLNFNAVAQGYSCDLLAAYLKSRGVRAMLIDVGGEIYCCGLNPRSQPWTIGIDAPRDGNNTPGADLQCSFRAPSAGRGVVTSGNYRKYYYSEGRKISHTIDPRTGESVSHSLLSATIVLDSDDCPAMKADAYATFCMVVGLEEAQRFVGSDPSVEACLIYAKDSLLVSWTSPGLILE